MPKSKAQQQRAHAERRARERFGIELTDQLRRTLINEIRKPGRKKYVEFVGKQSHRVSIWKMVWKGEDVAVFYDRQRKELVTFMPLDWVLYGSKVEMIDSEIFRAEDWGYEEGFCVTITRKADGTLIFCREGTLELAGGYHSDEQVITENEALEIMTDFGDYEVGVNEN